MCVGSLWTSARVVEGRTRSEVGWHGQLSQCPVGTLYLWTEPLRSHQATNSALLGGITQRILCAARSVPCMYEVWTPIRARSGPQSQVCKCPPSTAYTRLRQVVWPLPRRHCSATERPILRGSHCLLRNVEPYSAAPSSRSTTSRLSRHVTRCTTSMAKL